MKCGRHEEDVLALTASERNELWEAAGMLRKVIVEMLSPDMWNYMFLGNLDRHVHLHMIPRYQAVRRIGDWEFRDQHWGGLHARQAEPPREVFDQLLSVIKRRLSNYAAG